MNRRTLSAAIMLSLLAVLSTSWANTPAVKDLEKAARSEGKLASVGMPDDWANWHCFAHDGCCCDCLTVQLAAHCHHRRKWPGQKTHQLQKASGYQHHLRRFHRAAGFAELVSPAGPADSVD